jgi:hypothetical protein
MEVELMQEIPKYVLNQIHEVIGDKTREKMIKYVYGNREDAQSLFENYIQTLISTTFFIENDVVDFAEIKNAYHRKRQLNKKNWFKSLKRDVDANKYTPIHQEVQLLENFLARENDVKRLQELYAVQQPKDLFTVRLNEIEEWSKDKTTRLTDYPYLESKLQYQLERAFET